MLNIDSGVNLFFQHYLNTWNPLFYLLVEMANYDLRTAKRLIHTGSETGNIFHFKISNKLKHEYVTINTQYFIALQ